jgi:hypothetical protein
VTRGRVALVIPAVVLVVAAGMAAGRALGSGKQAQALEQAPSTPYWGSPRSSRSVHLPVEQPRRLRGHCRHRGVEVEDDQDVALDKALVADVTSRGGEPLAARQVPLSLVRGDASNGSRVLQAHRRRDADILSPELARLRVEELELKS